MFENLANSYGTPGSTGAGINKGSQAGAPSEDLLGNVRGNQPDLGAVERMGLDPPVTEDSALCFPLTSAEKEAVALICL